jgi:hypothetical protein
VCTKTNYPANFSTPKNTWQDFLPDAKIRSAESKAKYGISDDTVMMARKADVVQIDKIAKELGLNRAQRRMLHDEIARPGLSPEEI